MTRSSGRSILRKPVLRARRTDRIAVASPDDFVCGKASRFEPQCGTLFPYCIDVLRGRTVYVEGPAPGDVLAAPFYYLHLRRTARTVVTAPIGYGPLCGTSDPRPPIFLFSPGRCGSTLLSRLFSAAGIAGVSEPDFYTQLASPIWSGVARPLREPFRRAMWDMTADLVAVAGDVPVVKLRAECCRAPDLFLQSGRQRTLMMFRRFEDWARSTAQVFGAGPHKSVRKYMRALSCLAHLRQHSNCHVIHYENLLSHPGETCGELGNFLGRRIDAADLDRAGAHNSQSGTPLEAPPPRPGWEAKFDAAMRLWQSRRFVRVRDHLGVANVWS